MLCELWNFQIIFRRKKEEEEMERDRKREERVRKRMERRKAREEKRRQLRLEKKRQEDDRRISVKIAMEERKLLLAQRKLESIRMLEELFNRIKVSLIIILCLFC
jgi:arginine/serine-rich splicing factor 17